MSACEESPEDPTKQLTPLQQLQADHERAMLTAGRDHFLKQKDARIKSHQESRGIVGKVMFTSSYHKLRPVIHTFLTEPRSGAERFAKAYLMKLGEKQAAYITAKTVIDHISSEPELRMMCLEIADEVLKQLRFMKFEAVDPDRMQVIKSRFKRQQTTDTQYIEDAMMGWFRDVDVSEYALKGTDRVKLGSGCLDLFIEANPDIIEPTKRHVERIKVEGKYVTQVFLVRTPAVKEWIKGREDVAQWGDPIHAPMFTKPLSWTNTHDGGFDSDLKGTLSIIQGTGSRRDLGYLTDANMSMVRTAVDALQQTSWQVNRRVHKVVCQIEEEAGGNVKLRIPDIRDADEDNDDDSLSSQASALTGLKKGSKPWKRLKSAQYDKDRIEKRKRKAMRKRYDQTMGVVRSLLAKRDATTGEPLPFFFTHRMDFRGRVYPTSKHFNPIERDLEKGMLMFGDGKPLGSDEAVNWFLWHGVNCLETDPFKTFFTQSDTPLKLTKVDAGTRRAWIYEHRDRLCEVAADPIKHDWWMDAADKPLRFLAFCFEFADYIKMADEGRGHKFVSYLPISLDGSCNGLQHYAALLKDERLAEGVNLLPTLVKSDDPTGKAPGSDALDVDHYRGEDADEDDPRIYDAAGKEIENFNPFAVRTPNDIYQDVASKVQKKLAFIAERATDGSAGALAQDLMLWGQVGRKLIKPNVMTLAYGTNRRSFVTKYFEFIHKAGNEELKQRLFESIGSDKPSKHFQFLAKIVWATITARNGEARRAVKAMEWFKSLAKLAVKTNKPIRWTAPSGFVVHQEVRMIDKELVKFPLQNSKVQLLMGEDSDQINTKKQVSGIAPNIIHSLDASHLMLTIAKVYTDPNVSVRHFATNHDSFACHAADTALLCRTIKEQFAAMYSDPAGILAGLEQDILAEVPPPTTAEDAQHLQRLATRRPGLGTLDPSKFHRSHFAFA